MAIIPQLRLFGWREIEELGDLERLSLVLEYMPDEKLMRQLDIERYKGRDDYPVRAMWNSLLAGIVFQHESVEKLRRELARNGQLREICGFFNNKVPPAWVYTRFLKKLFKHEEEIDNIFDKQVKELQELLPDFGKHLAIDSKAIPSFAKRENKNQTPDGRRIRMRLWEKRIPWRDKDGKAWEKIVKWFGYKLHLIVDATYELPIIYKVTKASVSDIKKGHALLEQIEEKQPEILEIAETLAGDRGYDDTRLIEKCWDQYQIKPIIDIRNMWKDGDETRLLKGKTNVAYDYKGTVYCYCPKTNTKREMANEDLKGSQHLRKYGPAKQYGIIVKAKRHVRGCKVSESR